MKKEHRDILNNFAAYAYIKNGLIGVNVHIPGVSCNKSKEQKDLTIEQFSRFSVESVLRFFSLEESKSIMSKKIEEEIRKLMLKKLKS